MDQWYELWDAANASLVGGFDSREGALAVVRRALAEFGAESIRSLVLTLEAEGDADPQVIAAGFELAALAQDDGAMLGGVESHGAGTRRSA
jgi:hypothetical protein